MILPILFTFRQPPSVTGEKGFAPQIGNEPFKPIFKVLAGIIALSFACSGLAQR